MSYNPKALVLQARQFLERKRYSPSTLKLYEDSWASVLCFCEKHGIEQFDSTALTAFLEEAGLNGCSLTPHQISEMLHAKCLISIEEHGAMPTKEHKQQYPLPERFIDVLEEYCGAASASSALTVNSKAHAVKRMLFHLGKVDCIEDLTAEDVLEYVRSMHKLSSQTIAEYLYHIRDFINLNSRIYFYHSVYKCKYMKLNGCFIQ
jgi:hypothetical protein